MKLNSQQFWDSGRKWKLRSGLFCDKVTKVKDRIDLHHGKCQGVSLLSRLDRGLKVKLWGSCCCFGFLRVRARHANANWTKGILNVFSDIN